MKTKAQIDNRGMTLVELLLAVVILGIIVVPLLHTMVTGATTERKSRVAGEATATAQDILETIEASDAERILADATTVAKGAQYYTKANGTFIESGTVAPENTVEYYIGIKNIKNGSSTFDALVTLNASGGFNDNEVTVSNPMDASINLMGADTIALAKFNLLAREYGPYEYTQDYIEREIEIDVTKPETDGSDFDITVNFNYYGIVSYTIKDKDDKDVIKTVDFADTETASARVSAKPGETPSVYLFFSAYWYLDRDDKITINNQTGTDVNFFLVNTNTGTPNPEYQLNIDYKNQISTEPRVFTNIKSTDAPTGYTYYAYDQQNQQHTLTLSGLLVENKILQRQFATKVEVFKPNSGFIGDPILSIDASKLN